MHVRESLSTKSTGSNGEAGINFPPLRLPFALPDVLGDLRQRLAGFRVTDRTLGQVAQGDHA
ncbi:MAG: hypothetical protein Q4B72_12800, partial [Lachnospiraceae bacterium]|nr:hypothetical protein [Lachnospiraceae bacterium]